ncbi:hypothetical protein FJT64_013869 [Amphibalanus amphitrite]|uniref:CCHC-type domain-containing protein n=1 Tax=Amphibalanus amphitrite TaxID=1232801 RepID=A0A6A4VBR5_AMPAM|nr:hypothetical protein FJT64_013869 [Amphibalanus amphitrite]
MASGWDEWTVQRREALLLHCVGQEARRLYFAAAKPAQGVAPGAQEAAIPAQEEDGVKEEGQPTAAVDPVAAISAVFQRLFPETRATHSERMLFRRCYQLDRSPAVYLTELQDLSSRCAFGDLQEQLTCEQFIEGCRDDRLRERLCREPALTVLRILEVAEELEVAAERQRLVGGGGATRASTSSPAQLEIAAVTTAPRKGVSPCCNCGGPHRTADPCCPARWRRCHNCQQKGHYARFCKEPPQKTKQTKRKPVRTVEVLAVTDDDRKNLWTELRVDQQPLRMLADTGSAVSILPLSVYRKQFRHLPLLPTAVRLEAYGGSSLLVQGVVQVTVQAENGNSSQVSLYVVDAGVPLLGRDLQEKLKLSVIHGATVCAIQEQMPEELPSLTGLVHSVKLKTEANPVQLRLRPLPYAVRAARLEADDWRHAEDGVPLEDGQAVSLGVDRRHTEASRGPAEDGVAVSPEDAEDVREREASPPPATERQAEQQDVGVLLSPREAASGAGLVAVEPALQPGARVNSGTQPHDQLLGHEDRLAEIEAELAELDGAGDPEGRPSHQQRQYQRHKAAFLQAEAVRYRTYCQLLRSKMAAEPPPPAPLAAAAAVSPTAAADRGRPGRTADSAVSAEEEPSAAAGSGVTKEHLLSAKKQRRSTPDQAQTVADSAAGADGSVSPPTGEGAAAAERPATGTAAQGTTAGASAAADGEVTAKKKRRWWQK